MKEASPALQTSKAQIIGIVTRALGYIDKRLIDHGERVAYIADSIADMGGGLGLDREKLFILCLLHDIGAYKTEEIDNMVSFETHGAMSHAAYGCAFLKNATPLGPLADAVLYHHTSYSSLERAGVPCALEAELVFLADRIDILLISGHGAEPGSIRELSGTVFSPRLTELFFEAERERGISGHIRDLSYRSWVSDMIAAMNVSAEEAMSYLRMLVCSIDFRSPFTVTHTANTAAISGVLAELFELDAQTRGWIRTGAFLHDIGKLAIPNSILEFPGKLAPDKMEIMKTHAAYSEEILRGIVPDEICDIAVRHHEKLNGTGYFRALRAEDLTLPQRIVAVADVLSALINRRSYKEPFSAEKTLSILRRMSEGGELCPEVCAMAEKNFDYIIGVTDADDDPVVALYERVKSDFAQGIELLRSLE